MGRLAAEEATASPLLLELAPRKDHLLSRGVVIGAEQWECTTRTTLLVEGATRSINDVDSNGSPAGIAQVADGVAFRTFQPGNELSRLGYG
jgi:hypothetical protein